jgi:hypothetical protein
MFKWIKERLDYRAKYKALLDSKDEASKNALMVMGQYEHLCANLPYDHELSTKRHWEEHADARLLNEYKAQTRALNALRDTHRSLVELWRENVDKYGYDMYSEWQPIETAPKDGTKFLALMRGGNGDIEIAFHTDGEYGGFRVDSYAPPMINEDWMTHWMPLPKLPELG